MKNYGLDYMVLRQIQIERFGVSSEDGVEQQGSSESWN